MVCMKGVDKLTVSLLKTCFRLYSIMESCNLIGR